MLAMCDIAHDWGKLCALLLLPLGKVTGQLDYRVFAVFYLSLPNGRHPIANFDVHTENMFSHGFRGPIGILHMDCNRIHHLRLTTTGTKTVTLYSACPTLCHPETNYGCPENIYSSFRISMGIRWEQKANLIFSLEKTGTQT